MTAALATLVLASSFFSVVSLAEPAAANPTGSAPTFRDLIPDADHAAWAERAQQMAQVYDHEVRDDSQTTETDEVWAQPDGSWRLESFAQPVRVKVGGAWKAVDETLHQSGGFIVPTATTHAMRFSAGGTAPLASIQASNGQWLSVSSPLGSLPAPVLDGESATYPDVLPDVDLRLAANATGFSQVLVVKTAAAAASDELAALKFAVSDGALTSTPTAGGGMVTTSADGTVQVREGQPTWWDSSIAGASADGPADSGVARPVPGASATSSSVDLSVHQLTAAADPVFPLYVDPSWNGGSRYAWTYVDTAYKDQSYYNGANLGSDQSAHVGYIDASRAYDDHVDHLTRTFFLMHSYGVAGKHVLSAQLNTRLLYSSSCTATGVTARTLNAAFSSSVTWNTAPGLGTIQDSKSVAYRAGECTGGSNSGYLSVGFNVTQLLTAAAASSASKVAIALQATGDPSNIDWTSWKKFDNNPALAVQYNSIPGQPAGRSITPCYAVCSGSVVTPSRRPVLSAQASDADGSSLSYDFQIWRGWSTSPTSLAASGRPAARPQNTKATWAPGVDLSEGQYEYRVRASDGTDYGPWSSGWAQFTVDYTKPDAPVATLAGVTTDQDVDLSDIAGQVGTAVDLSFNASQDASLYQIAYSVYPEIANFDNGAPACPSASQPNEPFIVFDTTVVVCRRNGSFPANLQIAAIDQSTTLTLVGFDAAGNVSTSKGTLTFDVNPMDYRTATTPHSWQADNAPVGSLVDTGPSGSPEDLTAKAITLGGATGVGRANESPLPTGTGEDGEPLPANSYYSATFAGSGSLKTCVNNCGSVPPILDMQHSFTVTAWVKPTNSEAANPNAVPAFAVMAQEGPKISGFFIDAYHNNWRFCMPTTQRTDSLFDGVCAYVAGVAINQWSFLNAQWDQVNQQVRLWVGTSGAPSVKYHKATASATGVFDVGVRNQPDEKYPFVGSIFYPTAAQMIATHEQLFALSQYKPMSPPTA